MMMMNTWLDGLQAAQPQLLPGPVVARSAHATHVALGAGVRRALITAAPQYYRSPQGWQAYDLSLQPDNAGRWGAPGTPARLAPDGTLVWASGYRQHSGRVGMLHHTRFTPLVTLSSQGRPLGARWLRAAGNFRQELALLEHGIKEELHILADPAVGEGYLVYETLRQGDARGLHFSPGSATDANGQPLRVHTFEVDGAHYTGLAAEDLATARYPVVLDPTVSYASFADGYVAAYAASYAGARGSSVYYDAGSSDVFVGQAYDDSLPRYYTYRAMLKFSLASLNPLAVIYAASLHLACVVDASAVRDMDLQIVQQDWSTQDPLSDANREAAFDNNLAASVDAVWQNSAGLPSNTLLPSAPLDVNWLLPGAAVYYGLRSQHDADNSAPPNGAEYLRLAAAAHTTPGLRPALVVDYFAVPSATARLVQPSPRLRLQDTRIKLRARRRKTLLSAARWQG